MMSQEIRRQFLHFFKQKGHTIVPSSSVVPHDDPTLLFTNAGMNQFKDVFLNKSQRDYLRATSSQKCIRVGGKHNDLDNVGHTARHLTFFEMLGNFSFGDYFKKEAIAFAWEMSCSVFGFDPDKIWITVFREDDESAALWEQWVSPARIVRMDEKDNFWAMGDTGPCGPCSELYYDKGINYGSARSPKEDVEGTRYLEFWNLVFMQFNREASGQMLPLPKQSIDTGAGLERVISLKMGIDNVFGTDVLRSLIAQVEQISGRRYDPSDPELAPAYHVIADHIRSLSFAMADGAQPSNVERGYILRKLLRRSVRYGRQLGLHEPFLAKVLPRLIETMGPDYPELVQSQARIAETLSLEEEAFLRTLKRGGNILSGIIDTSGQHPDRQISGQDAFKLKDTYGFPLEEILLIAKDAHLKVDMPAYQKLEEQAKALSKSAHVSHSQESKENLFVSHAKEKGACTFIGYDTLSTEGKITAISNDTGLIKALEEGQEGAIVLDTTPFYAEKGGQVGDTGVLEGPQGHFRVTGCHSPYPGVILHTGRMERGSFTVDASVRASVDSARRQEIASNHTATHLLHFALQEVLGSHIRQAGSLVDQKRLRFDFNHHKPLSVQDIRSVETLVNAKIRSATPVKTYELTYEEAQKKPQIKQFFGDKYGATVRVVDIDYSQELCGGTHTHNVSTIGFFRILKESSVAAGVRRIEAVTGSEAELFVYSQEDLLEKAASQLKTSPAQLGEKLHALVEDHKKLSIELKQCKKEGLRALCEQLLGSVTTVGTARFLGAVVPVDPELAQELTEQLHSSVGSGVILLGIASSQRCQLIAKVSADLVAKGIHAVDLIRAIAGSIEGSGGGKPEMAQAGGKNSQGLQTAMDQAKQWLATKA